MLSILSADIAVRIIENSRAAWHFVDSSFSPFPASLDRLCHCLFTCNPTSGSRPQHEPFGSRWSQ